MENTLTKSLANIIKMKCKEEEEFKGKAQVAIIGDGALRTIIGKDFSDMARINSKRCPNLQYLAVFFNFGYFLCLAPYRFKWNSHSNEYKITGGNKFQLVIVAMMHLLLLFRVGAMIRKFMDTNVNHPVIYFSSANIVSQLLQLFGFEMAFITNKDKFVKAFNDIPLLLKQKNEVETESTGSLETLKKVRNLSIIISILSTTFVLTSFLNNCYEGNWELEGIYNALDTKSKSYFMIDNSNVLFMGLTVLVDLYAKCIFNYIDLIQILSVLLLRSFVKRFLQMLKEQPESKILQGYSNLVKMTKLINKALGYFTLMTVIGTLPYLSTSMGLLFFNKNLMQQMRILIFFIFHSYILMLAASTHKMMERFRFWIYDRMNRCGKTDNSERFSSILFELQFDGIGMKAYNFYTVTYPFLGSVFGFMLTYSMLIVQFELNRDHRPKTTSLISSLD